MDRVRGPIGHSLAAWFRARYDDAEGRPGCAAFGRSIIPRLVPQPEISSERGYPVFNPNQTAIRALQHDGDRERSREAGDGQLAQSVHRVLEHARPLGEGAGACTSFSSKAYFRTPAALPIEPFYVTKKESGALLTQGMRPFKRRRK